jgi:hypothetical protein
MPPKVALAQQLLDRVKSWNTLVDGPQGEDEVVQFLKDSKVVVTFVCPRHPAGEKRAVTCRVAYCSEKTEVADGEREHYNQCRARVHLMAPYFLPNHKLSVCAKWTAWRLIALGAPLFTIAFVAGFSDAHGLDKTLEEVFDAVDHWNKRVLGADGMARLQIDETYIGGRKYRRGRRQRSKGFWFMTATEVHTATGVSLRTVWRLVTNRNTETCEQFVRDVISSSRSIVTTDGWAGYRNLVESGILQRGRHSIVNHSVEFVNAQGRHTNNAEGCHHVVKRYIKRQFSQFGIGEAHVCRRVALATALFGRSSPGDRFNALLTALKYHAEHIDEYVRPTYVETEIPDHLLAGEPSDDEMDSDSEESE